jgi:glycosyltransferase involved in cell wall biosynthesis
MNPIISIIIPCFNSGKYLPEALQSIEACNNQEAIEIIIVDDGSKDESTLRYLESLKGNRYTIIRQENRGPAAARNTGVVAAKSECLLFLDSDNKIRLEYIEIGIDVLTKNENVAVVYGNAAFFGDTREPRFKSRPFDIFTLLMGNYIDVCSVVRKKAFQDVSGFDESRILFGHEDWELWLRMHSKGWKFYYIDQVLFDYRVSNSSLWTQNSTFDNIKVVMHYVYVKHLELFIEHYHMLYHQLKSHVRDKNKPFRTLVKNLYQKYFLIVTGKDIPTSTN